MHWSLWLILWALDILGYAHLAKRSPQFAKWWLRLIPLIWIFFVDCTVTHDWGNWSREGMLQKRVCKKCGRVESDYA